MEKEKLQRCGACGAFQSDPRGYSEEEHNNAELIHCGCEEEKEIMLLSEIFATPQWNKLLKGKNARKSDNNKANIFINMRRSIFNLNK